MAEIFIENTQEKVSLPDGSSITEVCEQAGVPIACMEGVCGACVISVVEGMKNLNELTQAETDFLGETDHERLACQCKIKKGTVKIKF